MKHLILVLFSLISFSITTTAQEETISKESVKEKRELKIEGDTVLHQHDMQKLQENLKRNQATFEKMGKKLEAKKERQRLIEESFIEIAIGAITALIVAVILVVIKRFKKKKLKQ